MKFDEERYEQELFLAKLIFDDDTIHSAYVSSKQNHNEFKESTLLLLKNIYDKTQSTYIKNIIITFLIHEHFSEEDFFLVTNQPLNKENINEEQ